ncbi:hypothetical protein bthur0007_56320 [Bacillus thuringiensis serovar monterrey BGSC 4AJ1]|nr:hypothetical protein bthur0007_56320 [Bacillus thuringiensis serovar monterrey BGSC 4AJ1]
MTVEEKLIHGKLIKKFYYNKKLVSLQDVYHKHMNVLII